MRTKRLIQRLNKAGIGILLAPAAAFLFGAALNAFVMAFNGGQMPVQWPGGCSSEAEDTFHTCMTAATHFRYLADWIVLRTVGVASPGDMFLYLSDAIWYPALAAWVVLMYERHYVAK